MPLAEHVRVLYRAPSVEHYVAVANEVWIKNLTAGWVTGRSKKYSRYWCWTKSCGAVRIRSESLVGQFATLLGLIQPEASFLASIPTLAARSWDTRKERIAADSRSLIRRLEDQNTLNQRAIKAKGMDEISSEDFMTIKVSIETETEEIQKEITALDSDVHRWMT